MGFKIKLRNLKLFALVQHANLQYVKGKAKAPLPIQPSLLCFLRSNYYYRYLLHNI